MRGSRLRSDIRPRPLPWVPKGQGSPISQPRSSRKYYPGASISSRRNLRLKIPSNYGPSRPFSRQMVAKRSHHSPIRIKQVGKVSQLALAVSAAPEKHWFRHVSQFLNSFSGCRLRPQPSLAHVPGDSSSCSGGGARCPISSCGSGPTPALAHPRRHDRHAKQRFSSNAICPFSM
jgi:hypothetical protein